MPSNDFDITYNGAAINLNQPQTLLGDKFTTKQYVVVAEAGAEVAGRAVAISTTAPIPMDKVDGVLDATGRFTFVVGPSFGAKGDVNLSVKVGTKKKAFDVRFK